MTEQTSDFAAFEAQANGTAPAPEPEKPVEAAAETEKPIEPEKPAEPETEDEKTRSTNRFTAQTRALREAEREAAALRAEIEALKAPKPLTPAPEPDKAATSGAPDPEKYQYGELDPQYVSDLADFRADLKIQAFRAELRKEQEASQQEQAAQREVAARVQKADEITQKGSAKYADFDEKTVSWAESQDPATMLAVFEAATETSVPEEIFYHLATNPAEASRVMSLPPMQQMIWMARFEASRAAPPPAPKRVSSAPAPINTARGSSGQFQADPATMDFATFERVANGKG